MPEQSAPLNTDPNGVKTSAYFEDDGTGTDRWLSVSKDAGIGTPADLKELDPDAAAATVVSLLRGILEGSSPATSTQVQASSGLVANAPAIGTLPAFAAETNYLTGFSIAFDGATAGLPIVVVVAGLIGPISYVLNVPTLPAVQAEPFVIEFAEPLAAVAPNAPITITLPALGAGNTAAVVNVQGFHRP